MNSQDETQRLYPVLLSEAGTTAGSSAQSKDPDAASLAIQHQGVLELAILPLINVGEPRGGFSFLVILLHEAEACSLEQQPLQCCSHAFMIEALSTAAKREQRGLPSRLKRRTRYSSTLHQKQANARVMVYEES
jgi:hypothetical protein